MPVSLNALVQTYLDDEEFQEDNKRIIQSRDNSLTTFERILKQFIDQTITFVVLREQIDKALPARDSWGLRGMDFLMELNKLAKYHTGPTNTNVEQINGSLRKFLTGLNARNVGERIGQFHAFLLEERERLKSGGAERGTIVAPGNSALIISVFAFWLDWSSGGIIYYLSMRRGLKTLIDFRLLPHVGGLRMERDRVIVESAAEHQAVMYLVTRLTDKAPKLKSRYAVERFLLWITGHPEALTEDGEVRETIDGEDSGPEYMIEHKSLASMPESILTKNINELRKYILIDEKVIRRIYHGLLAGHVILTGPPGTGKTELARLIPELLWRNDSPIGIPFDITEYTTQLVTATDEWSVRTLIGGLTPTSVNGQVVYRTQFGHLTNAIARNWTKIPEKYEKWGEDRIIVTANSALNNEEEIFHGLWLIIDEFNRAPIDLALGDALTALGGGNGGMLRVPTDDGIKDLPIPKDFRIIGTLNSFDRNYLNQISEALKRRFSFIEILPPSRAKREEEQDIVLTKALNSINHLTGGFDRSFASPPEGAETFSVAWRVFEVIRIYRQLGTAQAITLIRNIFIAGFMQGFPELSRWIEFLDEALCDTIADQLQVLLPDELEVLYQYVKRTSDDAFIDKYNKQLSELAPRRRKAQLEALSNVVDDDGQEILSEDEVEDIAKQPESRVAREKLVKLFRLGEGTYYPLPQFARRLRVFKAERGL